MTTELLGVATMLLPLGWLLKMRASKRSLLAVIGETGGAALVWVGVAWYATFKALEAFPTYWRQEFDEQWERHK
jgi:hypothetical protein